MLLRKPYLYLVSKKKWPPVVANISLLTLTVMIFVSIGAVIFGTSFMQLKDFSPQVIMDTVNRLHDLLLQRFGYNIFSKEMNDRLIQGLSSLLPNIFNLTNSVISNFIMMIFILFFLLQGGEEMENTLEKMVPLSPRSTQLLKEDASNMVISNAIGIPLIIFIQACFASLGYWFFGLKNPVVWGTLTGFFGIVPILGTSIIWFPLSLFVMLSNDIWMGIGLIAYGLLIITNIDNVIRIFFLNKFAKVHPLITVFGIILGLNLFGFWGIIFGPLLISAFLILLKIYKFEFLEN